MAQNLKRDKTTLILISLVILLLIPSLVLSFSFSSFTKELILDKISSQLNSLNSLKDMFAAISESLLSLIIQAPSVSTTPSVTLSQTTQTDYGWYSFAKDKHNSKIADDVITPPFRVRWMKEKLRTGNPYNQHPATLTFLSRDGIVLALNSILAKTAYNITTGEELWDKSVNKLSVLSQSNALVHEFIVGTDSHYHTSGYETLTGLTASLIANYGATNFDPENSILITQGWCGVDSPSFCWRINNFSEYVGPHSVQEGKFQGSYEFEKFGSSAPEYIDLGEREQPWLRTDLRDNLSPKDRNWTVMLWYKWDGVLASSSSQYNYDYLFNKGAGYYGGAQGSYNARIHEGKLEYRFGSQYYYVKVNETEPFCSANEWCHLAISFDHKYERVYKNGELVFRRIAYHRAKYPYGYHTQQMKDELLSRAQGDQELYDFINGFDPADYSSGQTLLDAILEEASRLPLADRLVALIEDMEQGLGSNIKELSLGGMGPGSWRYGYSGLIDEFAIFDKVLSDSEISEMYNREITQSDSPLLLLHFDNDSSFGENENFVYDFSGNNFHGIPIFHHIGERMWDKVKKWSEISSVPLTAIDNGIIYRGDGVLYAHNAFNGSIIWQHGINNGIIQDRIKQGLPKANIGEIRHDSTEIVYSDGVVYSPAKEALFWELYNRNEFLKPVLIGYDAITGDEILRIDLSTTDDPNVLYNGEDNPLSFLIENNIAYIRFFKRVTAINVLTQEKIWDYDYAAMEFYEDNYYFQSLVLSGDLLFVTGKNSIIALNKFSGEKTWQFNLPVGSNPREYFTGLIIDDNTLLAGSFVGYTRILNIIQGDRIFALEQGYANPEITNTETQLPRGEVNKEYKIDVTVLPTIPGYENYIFKVINGQWPFSWEISSGRLPQGLTLKTDSDNYNSYLEGTPTEPGDFTFTVKVTDSQGNSTQKQFNLRIIPEAKELTIELQNGLNGYESCQDTWIHGYRDYNQDDNHGNESDLAITEWYKKRGLIKFNIFQKEGGPLPDDATITKAELTLYKTDTIKHTISGYRLFKPWKELEATWNNTNSTDNWETPGAEATGFDRTEKLVEFETCLKDYTGKCVSNTAGSYTFDISPLVKGYDKGLENNGWLFTQPTQSSFTIYSSEYTEDISKRPKLTIYYKRFSPDNLKPVAKINVNPSIVLNGTKVVLDGSASYDTDGEVVVYDWTKYNVYYLDKDTCEAVDGKPWLCSKTVASQKPMGCSFCEYCRIYGEGYYCDEPYKGWCERNENESCSPPYSYAFEFKVADDYGLWSDIAIGRVTVVDSFEKPTITTTVLKDGKLNTPYTDYVYVEGGSSYNWEIVSGNLPNGLSLNSSTGEISGTSTIQGTYNFRVRVTAPEGTDEKDLSITISGEPGICLNGDVDCNSKVDIFDLYTVAQAFGSGPGDTNWDSRADLKDDSYIDIFDLFIVASNFGKGVE